MAVTVESYTGVCSWSGWTGTTAATKTLSVTAQVDIDAEGGTSHNSISYTLDGSTWVDWFSSVSPIGSTTYTASIPSGTNLANVTVQARSFSTVTRTSGNYADGQITISNLGIS